MTGRGVLGYLTAFELQQLWAGAAIDDAQLALWRRMTVVGPRAEPQAELLWEWLSSQATHEERSAVLRFATGSSRLPARLDLDPGQAAAPRRERGWSFSIERQDDPVVVAPTPSNGLDAPAKLAKSHTCGNQLCLPDYEDLAALKRGMTQSILDSGFGMV